MIKVKDGHKDLSQGIADQWSTSSTEVVSIGFCLEIPEKTVVNDIIIVHDE